MNDTNIPWTDYTWNPFSGCSPVSEGCRNCYARRMSKRLRGRAGYPADDPFRVTFHPNCLEEPLRMRKPRRIFVCSMGDLFHPDVPDERIDQVFAVMALCPQHVFQVLTKRPERMAQWVRNERSLHVVLQHWKNSRQGLNTWPLPNVWAGVSAENQATADERIPHLLNTPAAVRFVSCEPLLGPVDLDGIWGYPGSADSEMLENWPIHWIICGGESGPGARPIHPDWVRDLRDQCKAARVPFFFKQWGEWVEFIANGPLPENCSFVGIDGSVRLGDCEDIDRDVCMGRVGKKAAGNLLDGERWEQFPKRD